MLSTGIRKPTTTKMPERLIRISVGKIYQKNALVILPNLTRGKREAEDLSNTKTARGQANEYIYSRQSSIHYHEMTSTFFAHLFQHMHRLDI